MSKRRHTALLFVAVVLVGVAIGVFGSPAMGRALSVATLAFAVYALARNLGTHIDGEGAFFRHLALLRETSKLILLAIIAGALPAATGIENSILLAVSTLLSFVFLAGAFVQLGRSRRVWQPDGQ